MSCIYSFRLPALDTVTEHQVAEIIERWANSSPYYSFENLNLKNEKHHTSYACQEAELDFLRYEEKHLTYIAAKLSKNDLLNAEWDAIVIYEKNKKTEKGYFNIQLYRGIRDSRRASNMNGLPILPDIIHLLLEYKCIDTDAGLPVLLYARPLSSIKNISNYVNPTDTICELPIIYINCFQHPELYNTVQRLTSHIYCVAHFITLESQEDLDLWKQLHNTNSAPAPVELHFKKINIVKKLEILEPDTLFDLLLLNVSYYTPQILPSDLIEWKQLETLVLANTSNKHTLSGQNPCTADTDGYYFMNQQMADLIKSLRKKAGLSQAELANMTGTTGLIISRLETLRITKIKKSVLCKLEEIFNLEPGTLIKMETLLGDVHEGTSKNLVAAVPTPAPVSAIAPAPVPAATPAPAVAPVKAQFCRLCGTKLFEDSVFCHACGTKVIF